MNTYRCPKCSRIAFRGLVSVGRIEVKCRSCGAYTNWEFGQAAISDHKGLVSPAAMPVY